MAAHGSTTDSGRGSVVTKVPRALQKTSILPESGQIRFLDGAVVALAAALSTAWTATRPTTASNFAWGMGSSVAGLFMMVQGKGELRNAGMGILGGNIGYLTLRLTKPDLRQQG